MNIRRQQSAPEKSAEPRPAADASAPPQLVSIEKPVYGGSFLARVDGKAVFVPMALPREQARVRITEDKRAYSSAEVDRIVIAAPERIAPACRHFGSCGGCHYQHTDYQTQLAFKQAILRETLQRGGVTAPNEIAVLGAASESHSWAYRNRIRLALDSAGNPGYRSRHSHALVPIDECPIAAPLLVKAARTFAEFSKQFPLFLAPREISLFCDAAESSLLATVFAARPAKERAALNRFDAFARALAGQIPALRGLELVAEDGRGQTPRTVANWGANSIAYRAAGFDYRVDHGAFFQVNRWLIDALVDEVTGELAEPPAGGHQSDLAWDLFAGVGLFARKLEGGFARVVAVESAPSAIAALTENLRGTSGSAVRASTADFLRRSANGKRPDLIVVDPPRTGLGAQITTMLAAIAAPALVYVSCDPATLARDLRALLASGYAIERLTLADLFPHTFHLETVVRLRRS